MTQKMANFEVSLRKEESQESLIKRFVRKTKKERIVEDFTDRSRFKKPSEQRKEESFRRKMAARKLRDKEIQEEKLADSKY